MLTVLGDIAEFERDVIQRGPCPRQGRGARGLAAVKVHQASGARSIEAWGKWRALREIARSYNVDHSTIHRLKARYAAEV
jgi:hypothetical protein